MVVNANVVFDVIMHFWCFMFYMNMSRDKLKNVCTMRLEMGYLLNIFSCGLFEKMFTHLSLAKGECKTNKTFLDVKIKMIHLQYEIQIYQL